MSSPTQPMKTQNLDQNTSHTQSLKTTNGRKKNTTTTTKKKKPGSKGSAKKVVVPPSPTGLGPFLPA
ncbi:hypothetical protein TIFTF001_001992 [Ficus carica]|uniref:Uncharacterized protein n=1 Tax=Ficus carica TaxID=3494 RepID=A0AA87ZKQ2_FICCA|nr:hypothetical protein TIFTF001_001992 [Ficus carica]